MVYNCRLYAFLFFIPLAVCCLKLGNSSKHCTCPRAHVSNNINTVFVIGNDTNCSLEYFLCHNGFVFHSYIKTLNLSSQHSHTISSGPYCLLENLTNITIQSDNSSQQALIICSAPWRGFGFFNFSNLQLIGLTFHQCGGEIHLTNAARQYTNESTFYFSPHQKAVLLISYSNNTFLKSVSIKGPYAGFGIVLINVVGLTTKISDIDISDNMLCHSSMCSGSGLVIALAGILHVPMQQVIVYGENVKIHNNFNHYWSNNPLINHFKFLKQSIISAVGITILTANYNTAASYIALYNFTVFNNTSHNLPIVLIIFHSTLLKFVFLDTLNFTQNKAVMGSLENSACGLCVLSSIIVNSPARLKKSSNNIFITNSVFHSNNNSHTVYVEAALSDTIDFIIDLHSTKFADNRVSPEGSCIYGIHSNYALFDSGSETTSRGYVSFFIEDIQVKNCHRSYKKEIIQVSALKFVNTRKVHIRGSHFSNNAGSAIDCYSSYLVLAGINTFINNTALLGGGISLRAYSFLQLYDNGLVQVTFINNTALTYGGGIYSEYSGLNRCFLQMRHALGKKIIILLINNSAVLSGSAVYADSLYNCHPTVRSIFHCQSNKNKLAAVTSTPVHIYTCDGSTNVSTINVTMYPGENISIGLRAYDAAMNPVYADAFVHLGIQSWSLQEGEYVKRLFADICNIIHIKLAVNDIINSPILQTLKLYATSQATFLINIKMIPCLLGFGINDDGFCDCNKLLLSVSEHFKSTITCTGTTISLPSNAWFGVSLSNKQAFSFVCHHGYCSLTAKYNALKTDSLCLDERTGIMCGTCPNTFSTVFGSDKCLHCSNIWLITIVGYAVVGLLLVLMLFVLKMTVSSGILHSLLTCVLSMSMTGY